MARRKTPQRLKTGGFVWGRRRVDLGLSLRQLSEESGISRGLLSMMETGRMVPKAEEFQKATAALDAVEKRTTAPSATHPPEPPAVPST